MQKETPSLTPGFNNVSLKKGDTFIIQLLEGGIAGLSYSFEIVAGKATQTGASEPRSGGTRTYIFKAEETGPLEIIAQGTNYALGRLKNDPVSYKVNIA